MIRSIIIGFLFFFTISNSIFAQKAIKKQGDTYFNVGKYRDAFEAYSACKNAEKDADLLIKRGICNYYINKPDASIRDLALAHNLKSIDTRKFKYAAKSYFAKQDYIEASKFYKMFLNSLKPNTGIWKETINEIKRCGYAKNQKYAPQLAFVENLGPNVNSIYDEIAPIQSPTMQGRYYFSSAREGTIGGLRNENGLADEVKGRYSTDMFLVDLKDGNWSSVLPFEQLLNTPKNDILQDFSSDGSIIYFIKTEHSHTGTLYLDTFSLDRDPAILPFAAELPFIAENGDKDLFVFNDSLIIFSSQKNEGYGGFDLYYAIKSHNIWQLPVNFGPMINSGANEIGPVLAKNGSKLYFSSDRLETLGGFDIFSADYTDVGAWTKCKNLGVLINSPKDDIDFELSADGMTALFSSDRLESIGGFDIYIAYFKEQILDQLAFVERPMFVPVESDSSMVSENIEQIVSPSPEVLPMRDFVSKALFFNENEDVLTPSNIAQIKKITELMVIYPDINVMLKSHCVSEGRPDFDLYFSIKRAEKIAEKLITSGVSPHRIFMQGCGANFPIALPSINGIPSTLAAKTNRRIDLEILNFQDINLRVIMETPTVAEQYRDTLWDNFENKNKGVTFRVRFSKVSQMLKSDVLSLRNDAIVEKKANEEQYTYTMGNFVLYNDARLLKGELIRNGMPESSIIPYYQGVELDRTKMALIRNQYPELKNFIDVE
ncbi:MAG: PD40 domain-containing protein [Saprospiraceae bacterium]|nr:PD40 domain-containing protein [Saprospiraceae bacterium]